MPMLNDLSAADIAQLRHRCRRRSGGNALSRYNRALNLGLLCNADADTTGLRTHLAEAARLGIDRLWEREGRKRQVDYIPQDLELPLLCAAAFGDAATRARAAGLPQALWLAPQTPSWRPCAACFSVLQAYVGGKDVDAADTANLLAVCGTPPAPLRILLWVPAMAAGLRALSLRDADGLAQAASTLLDLHRDAATAGDWRRLSEGLVALWPLALEAVARRFGLTCAIDSPYLPLAALTLPAPDGAAGRGTEAL